MTTLMFILGIGLFAFGLLVSIAWHELGHLSFAKLFGIRVPQYMVGFGPTLWSTRRGETEYGLKAVPLGGYVRMIGMFPPKKDEAYGRTASSAPWRAMIEDARQASAEEVRPEDAHRQFYQRKPWKRIIVMVAGPVMNLILAVGIFAAILMGHGIQQGTTTVSSVSECVLPATADTTAEIAQDMAKTRGTETPRLCATCWSKAVARIARPCLLAVKNQAKPAMIRTDMPRLRR